MLLYLVYDDEKQTCSHPLIAPDLLTAYQALNELNPSNLSHLHIHELTTFDTHLDLFKITIDKNKPLPHFITRSESAGETNGSTPQT